MAQGKDKVKRKLKKLCREGTQQGLWTRQELTGIFWSLHCNFEKSKTLNPIDAQLCNFITLYPTEFTKAKSWTLIPLWPSNWVWKKRLRSCLQHEENVYTIWVIHSWDTEYLFSQILLDNIKVPLLSLI